jgi:hypothetical protein
MVDFYTSLVLTSAVVTARRDSFSKYRSAYFGLQHSLTVVTCIRMLSCYGEVSQCTPTVYVGRHQHWNLSRREWNSVLLKTEFEVHGEVLEACSDMWGPDRQNRGAKAAVWQWRAGGAVALVSVDSSLTILQ